MQPHWKAEAKLVSKGKELENKSVKDQRPGLKKDDMRDHMSGYNYEDEDQVSRRSNKQVAGVETQGVETQGSATRRPGRQVTGEVQSSDSEEFNLVQPPYCLEQLKLTTNRMAHSCKTNSGFTERLLLRNSSKDTDNSGKNFRKEVKVLEVMDKLKKVVKAENPKIVFHNNSTKSMESPQTPRIGGDFLGAGSPAANWKKRKKNFFKEQATKVHQSISTDWLRVTIVKPIAFYREFGEDSEFFSDCLATRKELQKSGLSSPRFLSPMKPKNETIIEELKKKKRWA